MSSKHDGLMQYAKEKFLALKTTDWVLTDEGGCFGGQACICFLKSSDGKNAVFRALKPDTSSQEKRRFHREVKALEKIHHTNVVKPFEHGSDWYITPRGEPLEKYWDEFLKNSTSSDVQAKALAIVHSLASGLAACHENGLIHCDIKPSNIVVIDDQPVIIDFGLVSDESAPKITRPYEPKGNRMCSHDIVRFGEKPEPWIDVFSLMQVFQQMMLSRPGRQSLRWNRPIHWQYASYLEDLSEEFYQGLRALCATCSIEAICPRDASSFKQLLEQVFKTTGASELTSSNRHDLQAMASYTTGINQRRILLAKELDVVIASIPLADTIYRRVVDQMSIDTKSVSSDFSLVEQYTSIADLVPIREFSERPHTFDRAMVCYRLKVKPLADQCFSFVELAIVPQRPSRSTRALKDGTSLNMFFAEVQFGGFLSTGAQVFCHSNGENCLHLGIDAKGNLWRFSRSFSNEEENVTPKEVAEICIKKLFDPTLWEKLSAT